MRNRSVVPTILILALGSILWSGCTVRTINHIMADPSRYAKKDVRIQGTVSESYSVLGKGAYQLDDGTGKLWIVSKAGVPRKGARVSVKGKVKDGFSLGDVVRLPQKFESGLVMIESSHKAKD